VRAVAQARQRLQRACFSACDSRLESLKQQIAAAQHRDDQVLLLADPTDATIPGTELRPHWPTDLNSYKAAHLKITELTRFECSRNGASISAELLLKDPCQLRYGLRHIGLSQTEQLQSCDLILRQLCGSDAEFRDSRQRTRSAMRLACVHENATLFLSHYFDSDDSTRFRRAGYSLTLSLKLPCGIPDSGQKR
jgi:hypothetical protein